MSHQTVRGSLYAKSELYRKPTIKFRRKGISTVGLGAVKKLSYKKK
jgi:hypothetical protein